MLLFSLGEDKQPKFCHHQLKTTDQHIQLGTRSFVYADDLWTQSPVKDLANTEATFTPALRTLSSHHKLNRQLAHPATNRAVYIWDF